MSEELSETIARESAKARVDAFTEAVKPLMKFLAEHYHPHVTAIVTSTNGQLVEGLCSTGEILEYIKD